jgi:hypothetical protein
VGRKTVGVPGVWEREESHQCLIHVSAIKGIYHSFAEEVGQLKDKEWSFATRSCRLPLLIELQGNSQQKRI